MPRMLVTVGWWWHNGAMPEGASQNNQQSMERMGRRMASLEGHLPEDMVKDDRPDPQPNYGLPESFGGYDRVEDRGSPGDASNVFQTTATPPSVYGPTEPVLPSTRTAESDTRNPTSPPNQGAGHVSTGGYHKVEKFDKVRKTFTGGKNYPKASGGPSGKGETRSY